MQALCRLPPTATSSLPSAADGKEATWHPAVLSGNWPIWSVCLQWQAAKSKRFCRQRRAAKACHVVMCRWHHTADDKDTRKFAGRWQTAKALESLPSAADGKEPVAVGGRRQRACILALFSVFSYTQPFSQQIDDTYIFFTWQVHSKHMRYATHIISSYMHSSINHT